MDTPRMSKGAESLARSTPQPFRLLNPRVRDTIAQPMNTAPRTSIETSGSPSSPRRRKDRRKTTTARASVTPNTGRHPTRVPSAPPMKNAETPEMARAEPRDPMAVACWSPW